MNDRLALLIIDMQLCAFDGKLTPPIHEGADLLSRVGKLIVSARQSNVPVIFIQHCATVEGVPYARGTHGWDLHPLVTSDPDEPVIYKSQSSGFVGTDLQSVLAERGVNTVITCGIQSEHCVTNTSISALETGLNVLVVKDAHGTVSTMDDDASVIIDRQNILLSGRGAQLKTTASMLELFAAI